MQRFRPVAAAPHYVSLYMALFVCIDDLTDLMASILHLAHPYLAPGFFFCDGFCLCKNIGKEKPSLAETADPIRAFFWKRKA